MKIKLLTNLFLIITSTYIPIFLSSIFLIKFENKNISSNLINSEKKAIKESQIKSKKIEAVKNGYLPFYHPCETKNYARDSKFYPIGSLPDIKSYHCDEGYGLIKYKTDRFGLKNNDKKWDKIRNNQNIFLIGDSFIHGACVPRKWTISNQVQDLTNINTINLGSSCNCPYEYRALLKSMINPIIQNSNNSNIVILTFYENDNIDSNKIDDKHLKDIKTIVNTDLDSEMHPSKEYIDFINKLIKENYAINKESIANKIRSNNKDSNERNIKESFIYKTITLYPFRSRLRNYWFAPSRKSIELLSKVCSGKCKPYVAYIPNSSQWRPSNSEGKFKKRLINYSKNNGIKFIDTQNVIDTNSLKDYSPYGPHLSKNGYTKVSRYIANIILSNY